MTNRTLSPTAQAVLNAAYKRMDDNPHNEVEATLAAALRAVVDQVVPEPDDWDKDNFSIQALRLRWIVRDQILSIAAELEGVND
jgi:hypothetical protein